MPAPVRADMETARAGWPASAASARTRRLSVSASAASPLQQVEFVQHQQLGDGGRADLGQDLHHVGGLRGRRGSGDIDDVQHQRGFGHLFERGAKGLHQRGGQIADEADRVAQQHAPAGGQRQRRAPWDRAWRTCARRPARRLR